MPDLSPSVRVEGILSGADITPATRLEYFLSKAANEIPKPVGASDAGKVLTVKADGSGFELATPTGGTPQYLEVLDASTLVLDATVPSIYIAAVVEGATAFMDAFYNGKTSMISYGRIYTDNGSLVMDDQEVSAYGYFVGVDGGGYPITVGSYLDENNKVKLAIISWDLADPE